MPINWPNLLTWLRILMIPLIVGQFIPEGDGIGPVNWVRYLLNVSPIALLPILAPTPREREQVILCLLLGFHLLNLSLHGVRVGLGIGRHLRRFVLQRLECRLQCSFQRPPGLVTPETE